MSKSKVVPAASTKPTSAEQRRLQMADIARMAGVSTATVSRALNGSPLISEATRKRIADLAQSLNYSINVSAKNLRQGNNRTVAVVVPYDAATRQHVSDPFFLGMLGSIADALTDRGMDMLLSRVDAERLDLAAQLHDSGRAIGIILIGQWHHHDQLNELAVRRVPFVVWGAQLPQQLYATVGSDNLAGGQMATEHLLAAGRKRIAFFGDTELPEVALRYEGYKRAHKKLRVPLAQELTVPVAFLADSAREAARALCEKRVQFDGLFATSDLLAMTAIGTLQEFGHSVPDDVAVVGYDDIELARYFHPPITTIHQSIEAAGQALVDSLLALMEGGRPHPVLLPTELIVRASTAAAARTPATTRSSA